MATAGVSASSSARRFASPSGRDARLARAAEGDEPRVAQLQRARAPEELGVLGVGGRPAALDVVDAEGVEQPRDAELVLDGEAQALALRAVAQRGVEQPDIHRVLHASPPK